MSEGAPAAPAPPPAKADKTARKKRGAGPGRPFPKGKSGNPAGRPLGARSLLSQAYVEDLHALWQEGGMAALRKVRKENPLEFVKAVGKLVPQQFGLADEDKADFREVWARVAAKQLAALC